MYSYYLDSLARGTKRKAGIVSNLEMRKNKILKRKLKSIEAVNQKTGGGVYSEEAKKQEAKLWTTNKD